MTFWVVVGQERTRPERSRIMTVSIAGRSCRGLTYSVMVASIAIELFFERQEFFV